MGWGCHPDTLTIARANRFADQSGHKQGSLEWIKAYRNGYEIAANGQYPDSLKVYLESLDRHIAELENKT